MNNRSDKMLEDIFDSGAVCAEECTGLVQSIMLDLDELARYRNEFLKK